MAKIDELIAQVSDGKLRDDLASAAADLRRRKRFGLVYEEHIPETVLLAAEAGLRPGATVVIRTEPHSKIRWTVEQVSKGKATITDGTTGRTVEIANLLVVKPFGEPVFPVLRAAAETISRGGGKPFHAVVNGENFHALQLLLFDYEHQVDMIYIDPPYNTGEPDWTYNNQFVDENDSWRHSKWLSFMEKRLRLSKRLLKPDGVLVVTIDEHEIYHLGLLLEELFPEARRQMVTIVTNAAGVTQGGFSRVEEYAIFCFLGSARPVASADDLLSDESRTTNKAPVWFSFIRYGGINALPSRRPNLVYPIAINDATNRIVKTGRTLKDRVQAGEVSGDLNAWRPDPTEAIDGFPVIWPFRKDGSISTWQYNPENLAKLVADGFVRVRPQKNGPGGNKFSISYIKRGNQEKIRAGEIATEGREADNGPYIVDDPEWFGVPKTVWRRTRHDAGKWGSRTLRELLGSVNFDYTKSPYAVLDTLRAVVGDKRDALVVDYFAGSGTTLHSLAMLNAEDGGARHCVLVTNNQVDEATSQRLNQQGLYVGDDEFESHGIARAVTFPRVRAALTGMRADGTPIDGQYQSGAKIADGFQENSAFFDLVYDDPDRIEVGQRLEDILPTLWLAAGAVGNPNALVATDKWVMPSDSPFAVLLDEDVYREFLAEIRQRTDLTHVWLVTDSEAAFAQMRSRLPKELAVGMLYRDYLRNFRINVEA